MMVIGVFLILDGKLSVGALGAASMLAGRVLAPISGLATVITRATQTFIAMRAIDRIMSLERERSPTRNYVTRRIEAGQHRVRERDLQVSERRPRTRWKKSPSRSRQENASASSGALDPERPRSEARRRIL